ncbi:type II secretion system protein N [Thiomicrorhabdus lithotrophica]|uniref:Type II secretion system protein N n=1 Tax=Thiomicrorhabdus lithotrophica TaxID=2949997 RepID=A0ABY8C966_9GAMM|nr:type II secretion system protein N [Thiomicrorhabdus lithotrophica]WEJ62514.1 type II secretion system protein N [Thiomicrorhabdus lithotrophica]
MLISGLGSKKQIGLFALLFIAAVMISIVVQLPANWLLSQPSIKSVIERDINQTQQIKITASRGTIWQGEIDLALHNRTATNGKVSLGTVGFDLNLLSLLWANMSADIHWYLAGSTIATTADLGMLSSSDNRSIELSDTQGVIKIDELLAKLNMPSLSRIPALQNIAGLVAINQLDLVYGLNSRWFSELNADLQVDGLSILNNDFPPIKLDAAFQDKGIVFNLNSEHKAWQLTGNGSLSPKKLYRFDLSVKANSADSLPDWAFLMQKKSAANYIAKFQGRLF